MNPLLAYIRQLRVNLTLRSVADLFDLTAYGLLFWLDWRVAVGVLLLYWANVLRSMQS